MAIDLKYGRVTTERGDIGEDEPVVEHVCSPETAVINKKIVKVCIICRRPM